ncbi:ABC transporter permease [Vagococcus sp. BWB3-3]|uniref:ABC transporter permease n=1 Tax=Vagococcus allomyrinae TaxID=2794353 RepID=A0A940SUJ3_9ENTE|nr:ABC transporter permease [Vagococcus allomyrinae]MBP1041370.1 ABC transporter permease [Vagococcus allomyrinae]
MNFKQLVVRNVLRNGRAYASYFLSSLLSVMVFFIFALLYFHPTLQKSMIASGEVISSLAAMGIMVAQVVIVIMSFIFLWYTFSVFLKSRKRDFSVYLILGMSEKDLRKMIFLENLILGISASGLGILVSTIFAKFILLVSQNLLALEEGMPFYLPTKPIALTLVVYGAIFLCISLITTARIQTENLADMSKSADRPSPEAKTNWYLACASLLLLLGGYASVYLFVRCFRSAGTLGIWLLVMCVLLTIAGTFLFFNQNSIRVFTYLKGRPLFFKRTNMLTISNLVYRMKSNATLYFMIGIVASVAFVAIGTTMAVGGSDFAMTQDNSFAYVYQVNGAADGTASDYHRENVRFIQRAIEKSGVDPFVMEVLPLGIDYRSKDSKESTYLHVVPLSQVNQLLAADQKKAVSLESESSLLLFATSNSMVNNVKEHQWDQLVVDGLMSYSAKEEQDPITYQYTTQQLNLSLGAIGVVSDQMYHKILQAKQADYLAQPADSFVGTPTFIVHYLEWAKGAQADQLIRKQLNQLADQVSEQIDQFIEETPVSAEGEFTEDQLKELNALVANSFMYSSMYQNWLKTKQGNGLILMISVLIGAVFFTFAACILYFRLFGELDRDGKYHHSLHILGVSQQVRHKVVTREMLIMYFAPIGIAIVHFLVAMICLRVLIDLPVMAYVMRVLVVYMVFQLIFFFISRWRYLKHLDIKAESN